MNIAFTFKNFEPSDHLKKYARRRFEKLGRFFGKASGLDVQVTLCVDKFRHKCDVHVRGEGLQLAAAEQTEEMYSSIDLVLDKLESQVKKHVSRIKNQPRQARGAKVDVFTYNLGGEDDTGQIKGTERFDPKPMLLDEAIMQLESIGGDFLVFLNGENQRINVVYRRKGGDYALIDPVI